MGSDVETPGDEERLAIQKELSKSMHMFQNDTGSDEETPGNKGPHKQTSAEAFHLLQVALRMAIEERMRNKLAERVSELFPAVSGRVIIDDPPPFLTMHVDDTTTTLYPFDGNRGMRFCPPAEPDLDALLESVARMVGETLECVGHNRFLLYRRSIMVCYDVRFNRLSVCLYVTAFTHVE